MTWHRVNEFINKKKYFFFVIQLTLIHLTLIQLNLTGHPAVPVPIPQRALELHDQGRPERLRFHTGTRWAQNFNSIKINFDEIKCRKRPGTNRGAGRWNWPLESKNGKLSPGRDKLEQSWLRHTLHTDTHTHTRPLNGPQGAIIDHKTFVGLKFNSFMFNDFNKSRGSSCLWL